MTATGGFLSIAVPTVTITSPSDTSLILTNPVNVTGTAAPTNATWLQTAHADFEAGTKDNVTATPDGDVRLSWGDSPNVYDDFDDGAISAEKWSTFNMGAGLSLSEMGGCLNFTGTSASSGVWQTGWDVVSHQRVSFNVSAAMIYCAASGIGAGSQIGLYQDADNFAQCGIERNTQIWGDPIQLIYKYEIAGLSYQNTYGPTDQNPHTFSLEYSPGTVRFLTDGAVVGTIAMTLANMTARLHTDIRTRGDGIDVRWDNFTLDPALRTYDDFDDDSFDTGRWTKSETGGMGASENGKTLNISGTGNAGGYNASCAHVTSASSTNITFGELSVFNASASGYSSAIFLTQDRSNQVGVGAAYDAAFGPGIVYYFSTVIDGVFQNMSVGNAGNGVHRYGLVYGGETARAYADGVLLKTVSMKLANPAVQITGCVRQSGDALTAQWDNITFECNRTLYDDFDDNSFDGDRWTKSEKSGLAASESGGALRISGTSNAGSMWGAACSVISKDNVTAFFGELESFGGSGTGYASSLGLRQDANNVLSIGAQYDTSYGQVLWLSVVKNGTANNQSLGSAGSGIHRFGLVHEKDWVKCYVDNLLLTVVSISLSHPKGSIGGTLRLFGDTGAFLWDDITTGWGTGAFVTAGNFTSAVGDTRCPAPELKKVSWSADVPSGTAVAFMLRSSDSADMSNPTAWFPVVNGQTAGLPNLKRYVQYKAAMARSTTYSTPALHETNISYQRPVAKVEVSVDGGATWSLASGKDRWSVLVDLPQNMTRIWARATDAAGDALVTSITVEVDTVAPTGSIRINNGDEFTTSREVGIGIEATDHYGIESMELSEYFDFWDAVWVKYASYSSFMLSEGDGPRTIYARFRDMHGWVSEKVSDSIYLHAAPPTGSLVINGGAEFTNATPVVLRLNATDVAGITDMIVSNTEDFQNATWRPLMPEFYWELLPGNGERTVYAAFRNSLHQVSPAANDTILLDTTAPALRLSINGGAPCIRSAGVVLQLDASDNYRVEEMQVANLPDFSGAGWVPFASSMNWTMRAFEGNETVYARVRDAAGNAGPAANASALLDTVAPSASVTPPLSPVDDWNLTVYWMGSDAASGIFGFDVQYKDGDGFWTDWVVNTNKTSGIFKGLDGHLYSFRARAQDRAGNIGPYADAGGGPVRVSIPGPVVSLGQPEENAVIMGVYAVAGTSSHPKAGLAVTAVEVQLDGGAWRTAKGTSSWSFKLDTSKLPNGKHTIRARAFDGVKYSPEARAGFVVQNEPDMMATVYLLMMFIIVLLVVVISAAVGHDAYQKGRMARLAEQGPEERPPKPSPSAPAPSAAPPPAAGIATSAKPPKEAVVPPPAEPSPEELAWKKAQDMIAARECKVMRALSSLPRGLPPSLWGIELEDLASRIVAAEHKDGPEGALLVRINNRWFYGDETNYGMFMQEYKK